MVNQDVEVKVDILENMVLQVLKKLLLMLTKEIEQRQKMHIIMAVEKHLKI